MTLELEEKKSCHQRVTWEQQKHEESVSWSIENRERIRIRILTASLKSRYSQPSFENAAMQSKPFLTNQ